MWLFFQMSPNLNGRINLNLNDFHITAVNCIVSSHTFQKTYYKTVFTLIKTK